MRDRLFHRARCESGLDSHLGRRNNNRPSQHILSMGRFRRTGYPRIIELIGGGFGLDQLREPRGDCLRPIRGN